MYGFANTFVYLKQLPTQKFKIDFQFTLTETDNLIGVGLN